MKCTQSGIFKQKHSFMALVIFCISFVSYPFHISSHAQTTDVAFFETMLEIPVMPGLEEIPLRSFSFDKPEGEINEIVARMHDLGKQDVMTFYEAILPQFGWGKVSSTQFFRDSTLLDLSFENEQNQDFVRILIRPTR